MLLLAAGCGESGPAPISVLAASSLTDVLPRATAAWEQKTGNTVAFTFDSSSRLARQLESGAAADLLVTADLEWMDWSAGRQLVRPESRRDLLGNQLVLIVPSSSSFVPASPAALNDARIAHVALAGEAVPAGRYARAALESSGVWNDVAPRVVNGDNVRTTLEWVARGEAQAGVVYATDARVEPDVKVAFTFPPESHPPIVYPIAITAGSARPEAAADLLAWLARDATPVFEAAGFTAAAK